MDANEWITTREAAERLGITSARIRQLAAEGKLTAQKVGGTYRGQWLVKASDIEARISIATENGTMRVKNRMTPNPITATPQTNYNEALRLMRENKIKRLPVLNDKGELIGIVTLNDMLKTGPSPATTLNVYEIASLLETVTMSQIMSHPVLAVDETCSLSNAARFMLEQEVGCLPVTQENKLVGIITHADIFRAFVEVSGGWQAGSRIEARMPDEKGQLARFVTAFSNANSYIVSVTVTYDESGEYSYIDLKERGGDREQILKELESLGNVEIIEFRPSENDQLLSYGE